MINPFDLQGPDFLATYIIFSIHIVIAYYIFMYLFDSRGERCTMDDPYLIAYLRGGADEVLRIIVVSLIERGLLQQVDGRNIATAPNLPLNCVRRDIEYYVLQECNKPFKPSKLFSGSFHRKFSKACRQFIVPLKENHFILSWKVLKVRMIPYAVAMILIAGSAMLKISLALSRGHYNIGFLIFLTLFFTALLTFRLFKRRTALGNLQIAHNKDRFRRLYQQVTQSHIRPENTFETTLLVAAFGLSALPIEEFPYIRDIFPLSNSGNGACNSGGCGGSSGCGGGGGGGGGGGCGGGCGGCGG